MNAILVFFGKFLAVIGSIWMLAIAYKVIGDTWDALFSKRYKKWLAHFTQTGKSHLHQTGQKLGKIMVSHTKERKDSIIFPIIKPKIIKVEKKSNDKKNTKSNHKRS